jgi:hypothetical protein
LKLTYFKPTDKKPLSEGLTTVILGGLSQPSVKNSVEPKSELPLATSVVKKAILLENAIPKPLPELPQATDSSVITRST